MESQHHDQNGQHQTQQQLQHQHQEPHSQPVQTQPAANSRGSQKGSARPQGSSRDRRLSMSEFFTGVINFGNSPTSTAGPHARTPANRGRGRDATSSSTSPHSELPVGATEVLTPVPSIMDLDGDQRGAPRSEKASNQQSPQQHSFTFATPQNPRNTPGRKRARTLESPATDAHAAGDDAKVKGGHSLRKRARIDYAQMNEHEDDEHTHSHATEGPMEITVTGARSARKRRATADPNYDEEEAQPSTMPLQKKKARTSEKQRTVSPVPQRRPYQKRKSTVAATISLESPEQQPSDTELKDTIEVGAPMTLHFHSSSSQAQSSETASNVSGQSPSHKSNILQAIAPHSETTVAQMAPLTNGSAVTPGVKDENGSSVQEETDLGGVVLPQSTDTTHAPPTNPKKSTEVNVDTPTETPAPNQNSIQEASGPGAAATATNEHSQVGHEIGQDSIDHVQNLPVVQTNNPLNATSEAPQPTQHSSSQDSVDSDATEIVAPSLIPTAPPSGADSSMGERSRMTNRGKGKQPAVETQALQEEPEEVKQETPKLGLGLRPRRQRTSRLAENTVAAQEEDFPAQPPKEKFTPTGRKSDDKVKTNDRPAAQDDTGPSSPDTPRKRGPGRPPKNRVLNEADAAKPGAVRGKERRASRASTRLEHPRPVRSHPPQDFTFLTPYLETREMYPETTQDQESGMPTPLETPNPQPLDAAADEQPEDASSLGLEKESGSQDPQTALDGDAASNAPTPAAMYDAPTPATAAESAPPSRNASPEPIIESMRKPKPRRQYAFPRIRSPTDFINHLDGYKNLSDDDLSNLLAVSAKALEAWQNEWKQQKTIVDDEDNAVRRRAHDTAFMAREARDLAKSTGSVTLEKRDFEVKGIRADRVQENKADFPLSNPEAYERRQDMVAAQAWGFEWDPRPSMIGKQDPIAQREGLQNTRLRNRPKLSQRAAEAAGDEPVGIVPGKRTRKPRLLSDESKDPSRAPTPVEPAKPKRRRRRNVEAELADSDNETPNNQPEEQQPDIEPPPPPPLAAPPAKKPYTGKKRGPKPKAEREALARAAAEREAAERDAAEREAAEQEAAEKAAQEADAAAAAAAQQEQQEAEADQPKTRKRRRAAAGAEIQPQDIPTASIEDIQPDGPANRQAPREDELPAPKRSQRTRKPKIDIPSWAWCRTASSAPINEDTLTPIEEKRPSTASSTSSMRTVESSYSFRQRPRKNYSELADPAKEVLSEGRPRRTRKRGHHQDEPEPTSYPANLAPVPYSGGPQYSMANQGFHVQQPPSVLAHPNNNPFLPPAGSHPGPLLAPSPMRPGHVAAPPVVGANPFSAPNNAPVEPPMQHPQSPRRKPLRIKIINRRGQTATPQPDGPPQGMSNSHAFPPLQQAPGLAPLQPPPNFHGHNSGYEPHMYGGPTPVSIAGSGPGQVMFPVNATLGGAMSMPPVLHHGPPLPPLGNMQGSGSVTGSRGNSKPPGSGRATPAPSSAASSTGGGGQGGDEALSEKDYASMTKSEKMSASMKARWANGSMRQAVNKRKETLARKKQSQADKSVPGASVTPTPQPEPTPTSLSQAQMQTQSGPVTSILHQPGSSELPTPVALPPQQQQQHQQSQPPHSYGNSMHLMSGHDAHPTGGVVLPPPSAMTAGSMSHIIDGPVYPPRRRDQARQNPFLDHGYADRGPRLPFLPNGPEEMSDGRYEHWGPRSQQ